MSEFRRRLMMQSKADNPILKDYLTIVSLEDGLTAKLSTNACEYCVDGDGVWKTLPADTETEAVNSGQTLSFRGNLIPTSSNGVGTFTINKLHNLRGDCMSLLFGDETKDCFSLADNNHAFRNLFNGNDRLVDASELSLKALDLGTHSYYGMFAGCTNLVEAMDLPDNRLANNCYQSMFQGCTNLTKAPQGIAVDKFPIYSCTDMFNGCTSLTKAPILSLTTTASGKLLINFCFQRMFKGCTKLLEVQETLPKSSLSNECCREMFYGCTSLTKAPELPSTAIAMNCYQSMFYGCTSLTKAPALPATNLNGKNYCYASMFQNCTALTDAPELPAETLCGNCYQHMFNGCTSLIEAPDLPAKTLAQSCYSNMFAGCTSLTKAPIISATTLANNCCQQMFARCTSLETAPELNALTLTNYCYEFMFHKCSKLNYIKMMAIDIDALSCVSNWVVGVADMGTFVKNKDAVWSYVGESSVPSEWTIITE